MPKSGKEADINCRNATLTRSPEANVTQPNQPSTYTRTIRKKCAKPELRRKLAWIPIQKKNNGPQEG
jgi:hypothetical protein